MDNDGPLANEKDGPGVQPRSERNRPQQSYGEEGPNEFTAPLAAAPQTVHRSLGDDGDQRDNELSNDNEQVEAHGIEDFSNATVDEPFSGSTPSLSQHQQQSSATLSVDSSSAAAVVPPDQERQLLLLMLLGQVCALHDPTPRTFTAHVLEFFERGILDRGSIRFLYKLGLVPSSYSTFGTDAETAKGETSKQLLLLPPPRATSTSSTSSNEAIQSRESTAHVSRVRETAIVPAGQTATTDQQQRYPYLNPQRSAEVSAIRTTLEEQERQRQARNQQRRQQRMQRRELVNVGSSSPASVPTQNSPSQCRQELHHPRQPSPADSPAANLNPRHHHHPPTRQVSFAAEHHPLSFSRFHREFDQVRVLGSGAFGTVYSATSKMDHSQYAIKVVEFTASGFDAGEPVQQVVSEVRCLAACDHANVVRYYTSWLEPSWMTGSSPSSARPSSANKSTGPAMLTVASASSEGTDSEEKGSNAHRGQTDRHHLHRLLRTDSPVDLEGLQGDLQSLFGRNNRESPPPTSSSGSSRAHHQRERKPHRRLVRRYSWDADQSESTTARSFLDDGGSWIEFSRDDSYVDARHYSSRRSSRLRANAGRSKPAVASDAYRYQICLFIQMQLCAPVTLADWIRDWNGDPSYRFPRSRLGVASQVFQQLARGLAHVHHKGIIHRDLKPANIFVRHESHGINLKIGDFGLSKLIKSNLQGSSGCGNSRRAQHRIVFEEYDEDGKLYVVQPSEPSLSDPSSLLRRHHREPLTAGVGTASYSAPEQVSTRAYGSSADVFSLGLILLETLCCFSTEHERMLVFRDCRQKRKLPCELEELPVTAKTILACTESDPSKRPSAQELSLVDLRQAVVPSTESSDAQVQELVQQLREKDRELEQCKLELQEKQRAIETLVQEMERMKNSSPSSIFTYPRPTAISDTTPAQYSLEESSSSSRSSSDRL